MEFFSLVKSDNKPLEKGNKSNEIMNNSSKIPNPSNSENVNSESVVDKTSIDTMHEPDNSGVAKDKVKIEEDDDIIEIIPIEKEHIEEETNANKGKVDSSPSNDDSKQSEIKSQFRKKIISDNNLGKRPSASKNDLVRSNKKKVKLDPNRKVEMPDEIWINILSYVKSVDLFQNVSLACKRFYNIHRNAAIYLDIENMRLKKNFQKAIKVLSQCKSMKLFKIEWLEKRQSNRNSMMTYMNDIIKQVLVSSPNLKTLKINPPSKFLTFNLEVESIGTFGKKLEHLVIGTTVCSKNFISNLHELKTLKIEGLRLTKDIISITENCPKLESIHFDLLNFGKGDANQNIIAKTFEDFFSKRAPTLKQVSLEYALINETEIFRYITLCQNIVKFKAFNCKMTQFGLKSISAFPNLKELTLHEIKPYDFIEKIQKNARGEQIPTNSVALLPFLRNLSKKSLKFLVFSECEGFNAPVFKELSKQHFPELETIFICHQSFVIVKPDAIIKKLIKNCPRLKNIHLKGLFANAYSHSLLAISKDFNVPIKIHTTPKCISFTKDYLLQTYSKKFGYECTCEG